MELPAGDGFVVDGFGEFFDHGVTEIVLDICKELRGFEDLESGIGSFETVFRRDITDETHADSHREFGFGGITVLGNGHGSEFVAGNLTFDFEISAFVIDLESCLALVKSADGFAEHRAERRIDECGVIREIGNGDGFCGAIIDAGSVEFIGDGATAAKQQRDRYRY